MAHAKPELPEKDCATCGRPFAWRKKWERNWDEVKYCSKRCSANRASQADRPGKAGQAAQAAATRGSGPQVGDIIQPRKK